MTRRLVIIVGVVLTLVLVLPVSAECDSLKIGAYSQQGSSEHAQAGGSINVSNRTPARGGSPARNGTPGGQGGGEGNRGAGENGTSARSEPAYPTISSNSPSYRNPHPYGPRSFWYSAEGGHQCVYVPASNGACFTVVQPEAGQTAQPPINPAAIAAGLASQMSLQAGTIAVSPSPHTDGLTGAPSWFWLEPSPATRTVSVALRGEHVTVSASAKEVMWAFGDGQQAAGGPGVPYRPGPTPTGAVRHVYKTRCLPGDRGRDPNVLAMCGAQGYTVAANVVWAISYQAAGPVGGGGALPARTTATSIAYPVSEARAFLTGSGGGR